LPPYPVIRPVPPAGGVGPDEVGGVVPPTNALAAVAPTWSITELFATGLGTVPVNTMNVTGPSVPPVAGSGSMPSAWAVA
jgi:hypothetical protein